MQYLVKFKYPAGLSKVLQKRVPVNDVTSATLNEEKRKRKVSGRWIKRKHHQKYFIPLENDSQLFSSWILNQGLAVQYDPPKDGNCQFSALCHQLTQIGTCRSLKTLVKYLWAHPDGADGFPLELFIGLPWDEYIKSMARDGTYGDHLTLQAAAHVFQVQIVVFSTLGSTATHNFSCRWWRFSLYRLSWVLCRGHWGTLCKLITSEWWCLTAKPG